MQSDSYTNRIHILASATKFFRVNELHRPFQSDQEITQAQREQAGLIEILMERPFLGTILRCGRLWSQF
jgi:hypothetical protein